MDWEGTVVTCAWALKQTIVSEIADARMVNFISSVFSVIWRVMGSDHKLYTWNI